MYDKRKPIRWGLWIAVCSLLLLAYPLSLGPFAFVVDIIFLDMLGYDDGSPENALMVCYYPAFYALQFAPRPVLNWYQSYIDGWFVYLVW